MPTNYRVPALETFSYQQPILDKDLATPPVSPTKGDRYIVATGGTGAWAGQDKNITWYDGNVWKFDIPVEGWLAHVNDEDKFYRFSGLNWVLMPQGDMSKSQYDNDNNGVVDAAGDFDVQINAIIMRFP